MKIIIDVDDLLTAELEAEFPDATYNDLANSALGFLVRQAALKNHGSVDLILASDPR